MTNGHQTREENAANHARKNAVRAARRLAKTQSEAAGQANAAWAAAQRLVYEERAARKWLFKLLVVGGCIVAGIIWVGLGVADANARLEAKRQIVAEQWQRWATYRDANCKEVGNMYGILVGTGKQASRENGTVWDCANGKCYTLSNRLNHLGPSGDAYPDDFPDIK